MRYLQSKTKVILALLVTMGLQVSAFAEDDLLQILDGKSTSSNETFVETSEVQSLRKAIKPVGAEQTILFQFLADKKYEKALFQWALAYNGHAFQTAPTGVALEAFLKYKNNLKITGVEQLLSISKPTGIDKTVINLWKENIKAQDPVWGLVQGSWNPFWTTTFGDEAEISFLLKQNYTDVEVSKLTELVKKTPPDSKQRAILQWQLVLNLALHDDAQKAAKVLALLSKVKNNPIEPDLIDVTAARLLYQNGFLDAAVKYYQKIPKKSDYWFQAQEEMAWAFMRKGEPQNALAITKTLTYSHFKGLVGIESYLLDSFSKLKVCDYSGVIKSIASLKPQFSQHLNALEKLSADGHQPQSEKLAEALVKGNVSIEKLGQTAHDLPMVASRDETLKLLVQSERILDEEAKTAEMLYSHSLNFGNLQGQFGLLKNKIRERADSSKSAFYRRIQSLAKTELADSKQVLQRLHIVEVEMIQQVDASDKLNKQLPKADLKKGTTGTKEPYAVGFNSDKELWFDELSNFKVDIKNGCTQKITQ